MENTPDKLAEQRAAHRRVQQAIEKKIILNGLAEHKHERKSINTSSATPSQPISLEPPPSDTLSNINEPSKVLATSASRAEGVRDKIDDSTEMGNDTEQSSVSGYRTNSRVANKIGYTQEMELDSEESGEFARPPSKYEEYIASELDSSQQTPLDGVPFPRADTRYEKDIMIAYKESTEPGFLEKMTRRQGASLNFTGEEVEDELALENRILASISHYEKTPDPDIADAEFESLITEMYGQKG